MQLFGRTAFDGRQMERRQTVIFFNESDQKKEDLTDHMGVIWISTRCASYSDVYDLYDVSSYVKYMTDVYNVHGVSDVYDAHLQFAYLGTIWI